MEQMISKKKRNQNTNLNQNEFKKEKEKVISNQSHHLITSVNSHFYLIKSLIYAIIYLILVNSNSQVYAKSNNSCSGRIKLTKPTGYITDGKNNYSPDLQCTWLIDASDFKTDTLIRLKFTEFETECSWDHLYIFNGDSVFSQLVAAFSGVPIRRNNGQGLNELPELEIRSKQVYLYFYSDTALNMTGFNLTYSIHSCKDNDCSSVSLARPLKEELINDKIDYNQLMFSDHCSTDKLYSNLSNCNCNDGIDSLVCNMSICPNKCSGSSQGECDLKEKKCNCKQDFTGADCGQITKEGYWQALNNLKNQKIFGRALHQSVLVDDRIWIAGGEFFLKTTEANNQFIISYDIKQSRWNLIERQSSNNVNLRRFSHSLVHYNQSLYMYGGLQDNGTISNELWSFDIDQSKWKLVDIQFKQDQCSSYVDYCAPLATTGHTATVIDDRMIVIFGYNPRYGYLNTVQEYHFTTKSWSLLNPNGALVKGGFGHTSVYFEETKSIYVFGGHHSFVTDSSSVDFLYAYLPYKNKWRVLSPSKSPRYFHSAVIINNQMYVYGGNAYNSTVDNNNSKCFSTQFLIYNIFCDTWNSLSEPSDLLVNSFGTGRFGHTSVAYKNSEMYTFGGFNGIMLNNMLKYVPANCSQQTSKSECCTLVFTLNCVWNDQKKLCMEFNEEMAVLNNRINTALPNNPKKNNYILASSATSNDQNMYCHLNFNAYNVDRLNSSSTDQFRSRCPIKFSNNNELCKKQSNCPSCLENSYNCVWCDDSCYSEKCKKNSKRQSRNLQSCDAEDTSTLQFKCSIYLNCASCHQFNPYCTWGQTNMCFPFVERSGNRTVKAVLHDNLRPPCDPPCHLQTSCDNCTVNSCMWCSSLNRCIESNAYSAIYPLSQCQEWTIHPTKCSTMSCATQGTCDQCQKIHRCGWCDDGSNTGSGFCMEGHSRGPNSIDGISSTVMNDNLTIRIDKMNERYNNANKHLTDVTNRLMNLDSTFLNKDDVNMFDPYSQNNKATNRILANLGRATCKADKWFYTECPICQCNGHSICRPGTSICLSCQHNTTGPNCDTCLEGFYGNPINGGRCAPCRCNSHATSCDKRTSRCFCTTKGITGNFCEKCDEQNHYFGNPRESTCYYNLSIDFQYTFNMSKYEDRHFNKINFMNTPIRSDLDVDFTITCSNKAFFNISFSSATLPHQVAHEKMECTTYKFRFSHHEHLFGAENGSFFVSVHSFQYPFILQISFSQHRALDLIQFFVTFSSCFLTLLILAAILYKIKQRVDMYRRRQQFFLELEHLASRPFAGILLEIPNTINNKNQPTSPTTVVANVSNDDLSNNSHNNSQPPTNKQQSKLKAFTSAQRSHIKNFLNSSSTNVTGDCKISTSLDNPFGSNPTPIALEPCSGNKAAVLSLIVRLPTANTGLSPGQTGISIASALVQLGSVEQKMHDNLKSSNSSTKKTNNPAFV